MISQSIQNGATNKQLTVDHITKVPYCSLHRRMVTLRAVDT